PQIPCPLLAQLAPHGCLVLPMGEQALQSLVRLRRGATGLVEEYLGECRFVKLLGSYGWKDPESGAAAGGGGWGGGRVRDGLRGARRGAGPGWARGGRRTPRRSAPAGRRAA